jgi:hypothetical protein
MEFSSQLIKSAANIGYLQSSKSFFYINLYYLYCLGEEDS